MVQRDTHSGRSKSPGQGILLITRAAAILRALEGQPTGLSLGQIAERVDVPRATVQRLVDALKVVDLVAVDHVHGGVRLGPSLARLAASVRMDVPEQARPHLERLNRTVNETVAMAALGDGEAIVLMQMPSSRDIRLTIELSRTWPLHTTADGKVLLHGLPVSAIESQFEKSSRLRPDAKPASFKTYLQTLGDIDKAGYAIDREGTTDGICAIAAGVTGLDNKRYSISILAPPARFEANLKTFRTEIIKCRDDLAAAAGIVHKG